MVATTEHLQRNSDGDIHESAAEDIKAGYGPTDQGNVKMVQTFTQISPVCACIHTYLCDYDQSCLLM